MPQLNPSPFFVILLFSWCILLTLIPVKVLAHALPNEPAPQDSELPKTQPYNWQWL